MGCSHNKEIDSEEERENTWKILLVDKDKQFHETARRSLRDFTIKGRSLTIMSAFSSLEAKELMVRRPDKALVLLATNLEINNSGIELAGFIREELKQKLTRIILLTETAEDEPELDGIIDLELDDYQIKSQLSERKLLTVVVGAIKLYSALENSENIPQTPFPIPNSQFNNFYESFFIVSKESQVLLANTVALQASHRPISVLSEKDFGVPIIRGEKTQINVRAGGGEAAIVEMSAAETEWQGESIYVVSFSWGVGDLRAVGSDRRQRAETTLKQGQKVQPAGGAIYDLIYIYDLVEKRNI